MKDEISKRANNKIKSTELRDNSKVFSIDIYKNNLINNDKSLDEFYNLKIVSVASLGINSKGLNITLEDNQFILIFEYSWVATGPNSSKNCLIITIKPSEGEGEGEIILHVTIR